MSDKTPDESNYPSPSEILQSPGFDEAGSDEFQSQFSEDIERDFVKSEVDWAHLKGLQDHYWHKGAWSWFLMGLLVLMIGFQSFLLVMVGLGFWDFTQYEWLLPALLVQNLGQIIALAYVVVKSLFR